MTWVHEHSWKLDASPDRVFAALTDPAALRAWFAESVEIEPRAGGRFRYWGRHTLGTPGADAAGGVIVEWEPGRRLAWTWAFAGVPTTVRLGLAEEEGGTRVSLHHEIGGTVADRRERELIDDWWRLAFGNLASHLGDGSGLLRPDFGDPAPEIRYEIEIAAPPAVVFRALLEPDAVSQWFGFGKPVTIEPRVGGAYALGWAYQVDGRDVTGGPTRILELVENRRLVLDWPDWRGDATVTGQRISFDLEASEQGTRLVFIHSGFERTVDLSDYPFGWRYFLGELTKAANALAAASA